MAQVDQFRVFPFRYASKRIRVLERPGLVAKRVDRNDPPLRGTTDVEIPVPDLADCVDYPRGALRRLLKRNWRVFEGYSAYRVLQTPGGPQKVLCLSYEGAVGVLIKLSTERIRDPEKRAKVVAFQRWVIETIAALVRGEVPRVPWGLSPAELVDISELPSAGMRSGAVRQLMAGYGVSEATIYRWIHKARRGAGLVPFIHPNKARRRDQKSIEAFMSQTEAAG